MCKLLLFRSVLSFPIMFYTFPIIFLIWYKLKSITVGWILWSFILLSNIVFWTIFDLINISIKFWLNMLKKKYENESSSSRKLLLVYLPYNFMLLAKKCIQLIGKTNANSLNRCSKCEPFFGSHIIYVMEYKWR